MNQKTVLVTGVNGQVGFEILKVLGCANLEVIASSRNPDVKKFMGSKHISIDLSSNDDIREKISLIKPDILINPAAYTQVDKAETERDQTMQINATAVGVMAESVKRNNGAMIHFSTDYVYGVDHDDPISESEVTKPKNFYGASKLEGEQRLVDSEIPHLILRTSWVYGLRGHNFLNTMLKLAREREELKIVNDQWGAPTSATTIALATQRLIDHVTNSPGDRLIEHSGIYNLTNSGHTNWYNFAKAIFANVDQSIFPLKIKNVEGVDTTAYPTPAVRQKNSRLNLSKLQCVWNIQTPSWDSSLEQLMAERFHVNFRS